jgi:hypothetical protein
MRFLIKTRIPTKAGNKIVHDTNFMKRLEDYMNKVKPEAEYFLSNGGHRSAAFIVNIQSNDQVPAVPVNRC